MDDWVLGYILMAGPLHPLLSKQLAFHKISDRVSGAFHRIPRIAIGFSQDPLDLVMNAGLKIVGRCYEKSEISASC